MPRPVKVVYVTDRSFLKPTLVSVWSLLQHLRGAAELHVWGVGLEPKDWTDVASVAADNPAVTLVCRDISDGYLDGAHGPKSHISAATMGRLFIPRLIDGYVLYIDGDTLVTGDVSRVFSIDLGEACAGVVRDFSVSRWLANPDPEVIKRNARLSAIVEFMKPAPAEGYFNAGVILLNCDAIRARPGLLAQVEDVIAASACALGDQDHLNAVFQNNVKHLDVAWNSSWGRVRKHRTYLALAHRPAGEIETDAAVIVHYHGPKKPWRNRRWDIWSFRGYGTFVYKRALRVFLRKFPHLKPT